MIFFFFGGKKVNEQQNSIEVIISMCVWVYSFFLDYVSSHSMESALFGHGKCINFIGLWDMNEILTKKPLNKNSAHN